jgi:hypothetical protein
MNPYLRAHAAYHAHGEPQVPWSVMLDFHLQHGVVISEPDLFVVARMVDSDRPEEHPQLIAHPPSACWHIWSASGDLGDIIDLGWMRSAREVTFQRRDGRLHRYRFMDLFERFASPAIAR